MDEFSPNRRVVNDINGLNSNVRTNDFSGTSLRSNSLVGDGSFR